MRYTIKVHPKRSKALLNALYKLSENQSLEKEFDIIVSNFLRYEGSEGLLAGAYYEVSFPSEQDYLIFLLKWTCLGIKILNTVLQQNDGILII
jgi:hypothetical protein